LGKPFLGSIRLAEVVEGAVSGPHHCFDLEGIDVGVPEAREILDLSNSRRPVN
jgi:hypothetical protein